MDRTSGLIMNGLIALLFSLLVWKLTLNYFGWLALFIPGSVLVLYGVYRVMKEFRRDPF